MLLLSTLKLMKEFGYGVLNTKDGSLNYYDISGLEKLAKQEKDNIYGVWFAPECKSMLFNRYTLFLYFDYVVDKIRLPDNMYLLAFDELNIFVEHISDWRVVCDKVDKGYSGMYMNLRRDNTSVVVSPKLDNTNYFGI